MQRLITKTLNLSLSVLLCPEGSEFVATVIGNHSGLARLPARGADLTVLVSVLESLDHAEDLVDVATNGKIVDAHLTEDTLAVNDVSGAKSNTCIF